MHTTGNVLLNNAGIQLALRLTGELDLARVREELEINFVAPLHLSSLFEPLLSGKPGAAVVNISSGLAFAPLAAMPVYCASKAALHSLSLSLRRQFRDFGITVFEIAPPSVDSELGKERRGNAGSHGGLPIPQFVDAVIEALEADTLEAAVGAAAGLREGRERLFEGMNP